MLARRLFRNIFTKVTLQHLLYEVYSAIFVRRLPCNIFAQIFLQYRWESGFAISSRRLFHNIAMKFIFARCEFNYENIVNLIKKNRLFENHKRDANVTIIMRHLKVAMR